MSVKYWLSAFWNAKCIAGDAVDAVAIGSGASGADERGKLGPPSVDGKGEPAHSRDFGVRAPGEERVSGVTHLPAVGAYGPGE